MSSQTGIYIVLIISGCIFMFIVLIVVKVIHYGCQSSSHLEEAAKKTSSQAEEDLTMTRILLVCSSNDQYSIAINYFTEMLKKLKNIELKTNLRQRVEIGHIGITDWATGNMNKSDYIIFLVTSQKELKGNCDKETMHSMCIPEHEISVALKIATSLSSLDVISRIKKKYIIVVACNIKIQTKLPGFKYFNPLYELDNLLLYISNNNGEDCIKREKTIFHNLLSNAQLGYHPSTITHNRKDSLSLCHENDLNNIPLLQESRDEPEVCDLSMNIVDAFPSCETNSTNLCSLESAEQ